MRAENIRSDRKRRRIITPNSQHEYPIAPNLLHRDFQASEPNQKWLGDITFVRTDDGFLYLAAILDLFSRKTVGWAMEDTIDSCLAEQAFSMAVLIRKQVEGWVHHTDRGSIKDKANPKQPTKNKRFVCPSIRQIVVSERQIENFIHSASQPIEFSPQEKMDVLVIAHH